MFNKTFNAVWTYLKDWKNLLAHTLVGLLILAIGLALPIKPIYRIILLVVVIVLNTARMKLSGKKRTLRKAAKSNISLILESVTSRFVRQISTKDTTWMCKPKRFIDLIPQRPAGLKAAKIFTNQIGSIAYPA